MENGFNEFSGVHFDVLREIGNIGSGNAVSALAKMLNKKIDLSVPSVNLVEFKDISTFIGGGEKIIVGILVDISGDINGLMMFVIREESAHSLIKMLLGTGGNVDDEFTEMELSALEEIGNILCSSYLGSLATLIDKKITPSVPNIALDMANAIFSVPAIAFGKVSDNVLLIESIFKADDEDISGYFVLVPDIASFNLILSSLGVL